MDFLSDIFEYKNGYHVCGLTEELTIQYYLNYYKKTNENILIVTNTLYDANKIFQGLKTYTDNVCLFPMDDFLASVALAISPDLKVRRLETLERLKDEKCIVVTNLMGYLRFLPTKSESSKYELNLVKGNTYEREELLNTLNTLGYNRDSLVTSTGEYAVRGYIIDIFPIESEHPIRLEFFGDEIDSIRFFNEETQLSINEVSSYKLMPFSEISTDEHSSLYEYMNNPFTFFVDENQILNGYEKILVDIKEYNESKNEDIKYIIMMK